MELKIVNWKSMGLRCPDGIVNLKETNFKKFNFIQMPNFTGKTTYKELIQAALTGSLKHADGEDISKYQDPKKKEESFFEIEIECDSKSIIFRINFTFDEDRNKSKADYITTTAEQGGVLPGYHPPKHIKKMLHSEFVKLFVFDGEMASDLLNPTESRAFECIDSLCQLNIFEKMETALEKYFDKRVVESTKTSAKTDRGIERRILKIRKYENRIKSIEKERIDSEKEIQRINKEIDHINKLIESDDSLNDTLKKSAEEKQKKLNILASEYVKVSKEYFDIVRNPVNLHENFVSSLNILQKNLYDLQIPANATKAFFEELVSKDFCICDRDMNQKSREAINKNKKGYFGEDKAGVYNKLKSEIREKLNAKDFEHSILSRKNEEFNKLIDHLGEAKTDLEVAQEKLKMSAPKVLAEKLAKKESLKKEKDKLTERLENITNDTRDDLEKTDNIEVIKKAIRIENDIINTIETNKKLKSDTDRINQLCKYSKLESKEALKHSIIDKCNIELTKILKADIPLQIEDIAGHIKLKGQSGASEGQKLATGIIYLSVLLSRENYSFATIFDSPCGAIDLHVRVDLAEAITRLVKKEGQFITFVQGGERSFFTDQIEKLIDGKEINHITIIKKGRFSKNDLPQWPHKGKVETENAYFVYDKEYFNNFNPNQNVERSTDV